MGNGKSDSWKNEPEMPGMSGFYHIQDDLIEQIFLSPNRNEEFESVIFDFQPRGISRKNWLLKTHNASIDEWINTDPAIARCLGVDVLSPLQRLAATYRAGVNTAMQLGAWKPEYIELGIYYETEDKDDTA